MNSGTESALEGLCFQRQNSSVVALKKVAEMGFYSWRQEHPPVRLNGLVDAVWIYAHTKTVADNEPVVNFLHGEIYQKSLQHTINLHYVILQYFYPFFVELIKSLCVLPFDGKYVQNHGDYPDVRLVFC